MKSTLSILASLVLAPCAFATFHEMQIEQVIGGIDGNISAQAIQLRMRVLGQNLVSNARVRAWDAAGANPVLVLDMTTNVTGSAAGSRVLLATAAFTTAVQAITPTFAPDFTITTPIPASYLAAGRLTFESDTGTILWSLAWGGAAYAGSNTGAITNDADGNYGPPFGQTLPTSGRQGVLFTGLARDPSTTNAANYALSAVPATVVGNSGPSYLLGTLQKIVVEQPAGTNLVNGAASVAFGSVAPGNSGSKSFTIRNTGNANLTGLGITFDGTNAADFTVTASPTAPIAGPNGSTTFTVRFAPATAGAKTAALHIASNDATANPFNLALTGTGLTALEDWRLTWFGTTSDSGNAADTFDFDNDGLVNLIEFAFGLNPTQGNSLALPQPRLIAGVFGVTFTQPAGVSGITYGAEWSTTLAAASWTAIADTGTGSTHTFNVPANGNPQMFLRYALTAP
ncbi:MAG: choice-of-anchor D domain-containing protein [Verrucomicrobia bacterium]|nr:choice-of-anchor D domain-containing protein [Verrucomicrobiota bacterium]